MGIIVASTAFLAGHAIPNTYSGEGANVSPDLTWNGASGDVKSYVVICDDPDAPGRTWVHWTVWNIPPSMTRLDKAVSSAVLQAAGAIQGITSAGVAGYRGPMPPPGSTHHYYFRVYALDTQLSIAATADRAQLDSAMSGHVLSQGQLVGTFRRW